MGGFDIKGFISSFISKVENDYETKNPGKGNVNGRLDDFEKVSLFNNKALLQELSTKCDENEGLAEAVQADLGISLSSVKSRIEELDNNKKTGMRRVGEGGGDDGDGGDGTGGTDGIPSKTGDTTLYYTGDGGIHVTIDNSTSWSLTINITNNDAQMLENFLNAFMQSTTDLINSFKADLMSFLEKDSDNVFQMLNHLFTLLADDSKTQIGTLKEILAAINKMGIKIDGATQIITKLLDAQLKAIKDSGFKMDELIEQVKINNTKQDEQNEILTMILDAIGKFADQNGNFNKEIIGKFNNLFSMVAKGQIQFNDAISLLKAIKGDTSEINTNTAESNKIGMMILDSMQKIDEHFTNFTVNNQKLGDDVIGLLKQIAAKELSVDVNNNVNVNVNANDVLGNLNIDGILERLDKMAKLLCDIDKNTGTTANYSKKIYEAIEKLGVNVTANLDAILEKIGNNTEKLDKLIAFLQKMDANQETRNQQLIDIIAKLGFDVANSFEKLINIGDTNNELTAKTNNLINEFYNFVKNMPAPEPGTGDVTVNVDVQGIIDAIMKAGDNISVRMDDFSELLKTINQNIVKGNEQNVKLAGDIIEAIKNLGVNVAGDVNKILNKIGDNTDELKKLLAFLQKMDANQETRNQQIIDIISKFGFDVANSFDKLINIGDTNNELTQTTNDLISKLFNYVKNMPTPEPGTGNVTVNLDVQGIIDAIVDASKNINSNNDKNTAEIISNMKDFTELLNNINNNIVAGNEQNRQIADEILNAIKELGVNVAGDVNKILNKVGDNTAELEKILDFLKTMDANQEVRNEKVLKAIADLDFDVIGALNNLDIKVDGGGDVDLSKVIEAIENGNKDVNKNLKNILEILTTLNKNVIDGDDKIKLSIDQLKDVAKNILTNITNIKQGEAPDLSGVLDLLQQILDAIRNGEFKIKVELDGNYSCGTTTETPNEGKKDDWSNLLNSRTDRRFEDDDITGMGGTKTDAAGGKTVKQTLNGQYGLRPGAYIVTYHEDNTVTVKSLTGAELRHRVPKE